MSGGQYQALCRPRMLALVNFPAEHANGGVRVGDVAKAIVEHLHRGERFFVGCAMAPDFLLHVFEAVAAQIE